MNILKNKYLSTKDINTKDSTSYAFDFHLVKTEPKKLRNGKSRASQKESLGKEFKLKGKERKTITKGTFKFNQHKSKTSQISTQESSMCDNWSDSDNEDEGKLNILRAKLGGRRATERNIKHITLRSVSKGKKPITNKRFKVYEEDNIVMDNKEIIESNLINTNCDEDVQTEEDHVKDMKTKIKRQLNQAIKEFIKDPQATCENLKYQNCDYKC